MNQITVTEDVRVCPQCNGTVAVVSRRDRACWTCCILWTFVPPEDEDDQEEMRRVNSRAYAEEKNGIKRLPISRGGA